MQWVEVAHAVVTLKHDPKSPNSIAILPAAILDIDVGIVNGETLFGPFSTKVLIWFSIVISPPIPEPNITPNLSPLAQVIW